MKNRDKKKNHVKITEEEIKKKLYGDITDEKKKIDVQEERKIEKEVKKKLYPGKKHEEISTRPKRKDNDLFEEKSLSEPHVEIKIESLKHSVIELEEKLKKSVDEKEQLQSKPKERPKPSPIVEKPFPQIVTRMPQRLLVFSIVGVVLMLIVFSVKQRPKPVDINIEEPVKKTQQIPEPVKEILPVTNFQTKTTRSSIEGKYTLQVAEYADETAAQRFVDMLEKQGYLVITDTIYRDKDKQKPYFKINVGTYKTFAEAKKFNEEFKRRTNITDSFIKELKH